MFIKTYTLFNESKKFPNIKEVVFDEYRIKIGLDSESNDFLTLSSKPDDLWFHVKGYPGSHVVIKTENRLASNEVKQKAADLALKNSKAKKISGDVIVVMCKIKFVTKSDDMKSGQVSVDYNNAENIILKNNI